MPKKNKATRPAGPAVTRATYRLEMRRQQKYKMIRWCDEHDCYRSDCGCREES